MHLYRLGLALLLVSCVHSQHPAPRVAHAAKKVVHKPEKGAPVVVEVNAVGSRLPIDEHNAFLLSDLETGKALIARHDGFVASMSQLDRRARTGRTDEVSEADLLAHFAAQVRTFNPEQVERMRAAAEAIGKALVREKIALDLPEPVPVVLTSGLEEAGARVGVAYTREGVIYLNERALDEAPSYLLSHELFHVYGHHHPEQREVLYEAIGFKPLGGKIAWPKSVEERRISNPDAPFNDYAIRVRYEGKEVLAAYVCLADDASPAQDLLEHSSTYYAVLDGDGERRMHPADSVALANYHMFDGFFEQVGYNTGYLAGPEEILADNLEMLLEHPERARTPALLARLREVMAAH